MLGYLSLDIICPSQLSVFSPRAVRFSEQIMSADKYPGIFSHQMAAVVYIRYLWDKITTDLKPHTLQVKTLSENSSLSFAIYSYTWIPVSNAIAILPTIFLAYLAENDEYVPCAGEINMNCYTAGVTDWKAHSSYFRIHLDHAKCFERETPKCDFPIQRHINAVVQEFTKHLKVYEPLGEL